MTGFIQSILGFVRFLLVAIFIYVNWATLSALIQKKITWQESIDALLSNSGIVILGIVLIITFVISFFDSFIVRLIVNVGTILIILGLFTGTISVNDLKTTIESYTNNEIIQTTINPCKWTTDVGKIGDQVRTTLKDDKGNVIGYVSKDDEAHKTVLKDLSNNVMSCNK